MDQRLQDAIVRFTYAAVPAIGILSGATLVVGYACVVTYGWRGAGWVLAGLFGTWFVGHVNRMRSKEVDMLRELVELQSKALEDKGE